MECQFDVKESWRLLRLVVAESLAINITQVCLVAAVCVEFGSITLPVCDCIVVATLPSTVPLATQPATCLRTHFIALSNGVPGRHKGKTTTLHTYHGKSVLTTLAGLGSNAQCQPVRLQHYLANNHTTSQA